MKGEDPSVIGKAIMADDKLVMEIATACRWLKLKEFAPLSSDELSQFEATAEESRKQRLEGANDVGSVPEAGADS